MRIDNSVISHRLKSNLEKKQNKKKTFSQIKSSGDSLATE